MIKVTSKEIDHWFTDPNWASQFPPILSPQQAADLLQVPLQTIYDWSSRGRLDPCKARVGKHIRLARDRLIDIFFNENQYESK